MAALKVDSEDLFHCQICLADMVDRDPRSLRCNHTYCSECLKTCFLKSIKETGRPVIMCPTCRTPMHLLRDHDLNVQLPKNFYIIQMYDKLADVKKESKMWCEVCKKDGAKVENMCLDCRCTMCSNCTNHHKVIPAYTSHKIVDFEFKNDEGTAMCSVHNAVITSICQKCEVGLCIECTLDEKHALHLPEISETQTGIVKMRERISARKTELSDQKKLLDRSISFMKEERKDVSKTIENLEELKATCSRRYNEARSCITTIQKYQGPIEAVFTQVENVDKDVEDTLNTLGNLEELGDKTLLEELKGQASKATSVLDSVQNAMALSCEKPKFIPDINIPDKPIGKLLKGTIRVKTDSLEGNPCKRQKLNKLGGISLLTLHKDNEDITIVAPIGITINQKGNILVADQSIPYVQEISKEGFLIKKHHNFGSEDIRCISVTEKYLYLVKGNRKHVTRILLNDSSFDPNDSVNVLDGSNIIGILSFPTAEGDRIIISDIHEGHIRQQDKILVENLREPSYMTRVDSSEGFFFVVVEGETQLRIYDQNWNPKGEVLENIHLLQGLAATPWESFLVANSGDDCISEYDLTGKFIRHILTDEDGVESPTDVALNYPYLWITECDLEEYAAIKLFKLDHTGICKK